MMAAIIWAAAAAGAVVESMGGLSSQKLLRVPTTHAATPWYDVTDELTEQLPSLPWCLATIDAASTAPGHKFALIDPSHLELGPPELIAPNRQNSITLGVRDGEPVLPDGVRLILFAADDNTAAAAADVAAADAALELELSVEAASSLLTTRHGLLSGPAEISQAALRTALAASGVAREDVEALESTAEPTPAGRVYSSFIHGKAHSPAELMPAAKRAAHHISHLIRQEAADAAEYLRNNDAAVQALRGGKAMPRHKLSLILDNLRSAYNVGSIFRTADTALIAEIVTCGYTPHPPNPKLVKTAFGAIDSVPHRHEESTLTAVRSMQAKGIKVYAMETTSLSKNYASVDYPFEEGACLILGNEEIGVDTNVLALADGVIEIPTFGEKNSLNVASACPIVVYEVLRQWGCLDAS